MKREECETKIKDLLIQINDVLSEYTGTKDNFLTLNITERHTVMFWNSYHRRNKDCPINHYSQFGKSCPGFKEQEEEVCPDFEPKEGDAE